MLSRHNDITKNESRKRHALSGFLPLLWTLVAVMPAWAEEREDLPLLHVVPERLPNLNTPREGHAVFFARGELMVAGGHTQGFVPTATAEYLSDGKWHQLPMTYTHDHGTVLVLRSGQVLLAGGSKEEMGVGQSFGVEMYNPSKHSFTGFGCLDQKRTLASAIETDSGRVIITGNWYANDGIELFDGQRFFTSVKPVTVGRVAPYLFRTSQGDVLIVGDRDTRDNLADSIVVDRLHGEPFTVPLLQQWKPLTYNAPTTADAGFIGDEAQGRYAYLMAVRNYERTPDKPELKGQSAGQMAVVLVEDTVFTLLPTICPIPIMSPLGGGPIFYDRGYILADRQAQCAYLCGVDKDKRLYVVSIGYAEHPAPLSLYYTDPLPDCGLYVPALTPQGNLVIVGGSLKTDYDSDNFMPVGSAWLIPLGRQDDAIADAIPDGGPVGALWWWGMAVAVVVLLVYLIIHNRMLWQRKRQSVDESNVIGGEELMQRICKTIERDQQYLTRLKQSGIAVELGVSVNAINDCINNQRHCTFGQLIAEYRVRYAQQLLSEHPDMKLATVIEKSGFTSESTFFRTFKAVTGMSPKATIKREQSDAFIDPAERE